MVLHGTVASIVQYPDGSREVYFDKTFAIYENDYQKSLQKIARIDWRRLKDWFLNIISSTKKRFSEKFNKEEIKIAVVLERPMINAERFKQSKNAARAFEATIIVLEMIDLKDNYVVIDSKKWQHWLFGKNTVNIDLKDESRKEGIKFVKSMKLSNDVVNQITSIMEKHGDADSMLIARYALEKLR